MIDWPLLAATLASRFGVELSAAASGVAANVVGEQKQTNGRLRVEGLDAPNGFSIEIGIGWRSIEARFLPDTFAAGLVHTLCSDEPSRRADLVSVARTFERSGTRVRVLIGGAIVDLGALPVGSWSALDVSCSRLSDKSNEMLDTVEVAGACLAVLLTLLPTEAEEAEATPLAVGLPEGAVARIEVNRYERRAANRAAAIAFHGTSCKACGFSFGEVFGNLGDGFIEVHHVTPVSKMGTNYVVDPVEDLIPLCSNCHQMVHRHDPPLSVDELKLLMVRS